MQAQRGDPIVIAQFEARHADASESENRTKSYWSPEASGVDGDRSSG